MSLYRTFLAKDIGNWVSNQTLAGREQVGHGIAQSLCLTSLEPYKRIMQECTRYLLANAPQSDRSGVHLSPAHLSAPWPCSRSRYLLKAENLYHGHAHRKSLGRQLLHRRESPFRTAGVPRSRIRGTRGKRDFGSGESF